MSKHHDVWRNGEGRRQRARLAATLPAPCSKCGNPVLASKPWDVDHVVPLDRWPEHMAYPQHLLVPSHRSCNRAAGGRISIERVNARKVQAKARENGRRPW